MDCSLPGSSVHGIFQARILEWGAMAFSRERGLRVPVNTALQRWQRGQSTQTAGLRGFLFCRGLPFSWGRINRKHVLTYPLCSGIGNTEETM